MYPTPKPQRPYYRDRTRAEVDKAVARAAYSSDPYTDIEYLTCRYQPFSRSHIKAPIPDGKGSKIIVRDWKTSYDISTPDGGFEVRISPIFPYPVRFAKPSTGAATSVNTVVLGDLYSTTAAPPAGLAPYIGIPIRTAMSALVPQGPGQATAEASSIITARITTIGYRLFYTGTASFANGLVIVDDLAIKVDSIIPQNAATTAYAVGTTTLAPVNQTVGSATSEQIAIDCTAFGVCRTNATPDQVVLRPENGVAGVLKYSRAPDDHPFVPWHDTGALLVTPTASAATNGAIHAINMGSTPNNVSYGVLCVDDALQETNIVVTGSGDFRLEVVMCMEWELSPSSALIDMAQNSPQLNRAVLDLDGKINSGVAAAPFGQAPSSLMPGVTKSMAGMSLGKRRRQRRRKRKQVQVCTVVKQQPKTRPKPKK